LDNILLLHGNLHVAGERSVLPVVLQGIGSLSTLIFNATKALVLSHQKVLG